MYHVWILDGGGSQIEAELILFEIAYKHGPYAYYHLLSGVDLPLKSQNYIHQFMDENNGKEFVGFATGISAQKDLYYKTAYYHFFLTNYKKSMFFRGLHKMLILIQKIFSIRRKYNIELRKGCNWVSITNDFCEYLLSQKIYINRTFRHILCGDEIFLHSILWNSPFKNSIYTLDDEWKSSLREIDWKRGNPYIWKESDLIYLRNSEKLFARKFSTAHISIAKSICEHCKY